MIKVSSERIRYGFSSEYEPVSYVKSGDEVAFECIAYTLSKEQLMKEPHLKINFKKTNPVTGPVFVERAQPGDVLKVVIHRLELDDFGVYKVEPGFGVLGDMLEKPATKYVPVQDEMAIFSEDIKIPLKPNIGTIGVAPTKGMIPTSYPGDHGGNIDTKEIKEGAILYLPVFVPGALFSLGDLHICMGDGEICVSGGATGGLVQLTLSIIHNKSLRRPLLNAENSWFTIASAKTLDEAVKLATADMVTLLKTALKLSFNDAYILASAVCDIMVSQAVNPLKTARVRVPGNLFTTKCPL